MAFAYVGQAGTSSQSGAVVTFTRTFGNANGGFLALKITSGATATVSGITDQAGNAIPYTIAAYTYPSGYGYGYGIIWVPSWWSASFGTSATTSVKVTLSATPGTATLACSEFSGLSPNNTITSGNSASNTQTAISTGANAVTSGSISATLAGSSGILYSISSPLTGTLTSPSSLGTGFTQAGGSGWPTGVTAEYEALSASGAVAATYTSTQTASQAFLTIAVVIDAPPITQATVGAAASVAPKPASTSPVKGSASFNALMAAASSVAGLANLMARSAVNTAIPGAAVLAGTSASLSTFLGIATLAAIPVVPPSYGTIAGAGTLIGQQPVSAAINGEATLSAFSAQVGSFSGSAFLNASGYTYFGFEQANPLRTIAVNFDAKIPRLVKCLGGILPLLPQSIASKTPLENVLVTFDYSALVPANAAIEAVTIGAGVYSGVDPANSITPAAPLINAAGNMVSTQLGGGVNGCIYTIECLALLDDGQQLALLARMPVQGYINEVAPTPPSAESYIATETGALWVTENGTYITVT